MPERPVVAGLGVPGLAVLEVQKAPGQVRDRAVRLHLLQRRDDRAPIGRGRDLEVDRGRPRDLDTLLEGRRREGETPLASSHEIHRVDEDVDHGVSLGMLNRHSYYVDDVTNERRYGVA